MPFAKIKTDVFANAKVRRLTDEGFRAWVYLLTQAWEEAPNKRAGSVTFRGVRAENEDKALDEVGRLLTSAAGCDDDTPARYRVINELENVGMIHIETAKMGETVSHDFAVGTGGTGFWDITIQMHDWDYHNPRVPPSHTTDGERERKRNYRASKRNSPKEVPSNTSQVSQRVCPNGPTLDQDKDKDPDRDQDDRQRSGDWLAAVGKDLGLALDGGKALGVGRDRARVEASFRRWIDRDLRALLIRECVGLAQSKGVRPAHLSWFAGWLDTVSDAQLDIDARKATA